MQAPHGGQAGEQVVLGLAFTTQLQLYEGLASERRAQQQHSLLVRRKDQTPLQTTVNGGSLNRAMFLRADTRGQKKRKRYFSAFKAVY